MLNVYSLCTLCGISPSGLSPGRKDKFPDSRSKRDLHDDDKESESEFDLATGSITITTRVTTFHSAREYLFLTPSADMRDWWLHGIK